MDEPLYQITRRYFGNTPAEVVDSGLTKEEAQAHCSDPETSSKTCTTLVNIMRTEEHGPWFDSYDEE